MKSSRKVVRRAIWAGFNGVWYAYFVTMCFLPTRKPSWFLAFGGAVAAVSACEIAIALTGGRSQQKDKDEPER